ncbi:hypothetical protein J3L18_14085 [Mucilaginibacter gossypii]|uniref:hypothetical protein n=1 Tax=Mucilaginibacter gossypii TaxID=551996 RepID=UPI000DCE78BA|nr:MULTISPECIES: hypothetical protein [Mucilaginibacter]QTE40130.1 hypothetical protein J3L18_14085 [Mucilaginibacter gossypii]RAV50065.1 hypothetical protein DIU36_26620 [Mucilaginibacter rubeus]
MKANTRLTPSRLRLTPLSASQRGGVKSLFFFFNPLSAAGEERVGQRSDAGVSQLIAIQYAGKNKTF